jgi:hypothetical protein
MALIDDLEALIIDQPGLTESELAELLYGDGAYPQLVNFNCRKLIQQGRVERCGSGWSDPYRYRPAANTT